MFLFGHRLNYNMYNASSMGTTFLEWNFNTLIEE